MVYKVFDKISKVRAANTNTFSEAVAREIVSNQQLKSLNCTKFIGKIEKRKIYSSFNNNILDAHVAEREKEKDSMGNKGIQLLICAVDIIGK